VIQQGTVQGQRLLLAPLAELPERVRQEGLSSPAIVVIGRVVAERVASCAPAPADAEMPIPF
jgi:uroporphyrin-III C-methyltransferase